MVHVQRHAYLQTQRQKGRGLQWYYFFHQVNTRTRVNLSWGINDSGVPFDDGQSVSSKNYIPSTLIDKPQP